MYSTFFGVELGKRALITQQLALHTTSHNIANANTPGYSRQITSLVTTTPFNLPEANRLQMPGQLGTGVKVDFISRARDMLLERSIREETAVGAALSDKVAYLGQVEAILTEPAEEGIGESLNRFWAAWQELSVYPDDLSVRNVVLARAGELVHNLQTKDQDLYDLQKQADQELRTTIGRINELGSQIRDLNVMINRSIGTESQPNDLFDKRDAYLRELAELTNFTGEEMTNGLYAVTIGGHTLVQDEVFVPLTVVDDPLNHNYAHAVWSDDGTAARIDSGKLQGLTEMRDMYLPVYRQALDDLAQGLIAAVNPVHAAGYALNAGAPSGQVFFSGTGIQDLSVNPILLADPTEVAAATNPTAPGDGSNALTLARLKDAMAMAGGTQTMGEFYQTLISQVGLDSEDAQLREATQDALVSSLNEKQESIAGVNLDEEMTDMIRYQDGYQAAARVITAMDEMLDVLINRTGIVGR